VIATPSAANAAAPKRIAAANDKAADGQSASRMYRPMSSWATTWSAITITVEAMTAAR
jgi:hypothetical protein